MANRALVILAASGLVACGSGAPQFTDQDDATLRALFDSVVADVRAANWTDWAARFAEEARFHPSNGPALIGRAAIQAWAEALPPIDSFGFSNVQVAGEGNVAWGTSAVQVKLRDIPADTAKQLVVFRRGTDGTWRVLAVSVTSDLPLPAPPASPQPRR